MIKFYDKEGEVNRGDDHGISSKLNTAQGKFLRTWVKGILRCEVQLRKKCLQDEFKLMNGNDYLRLTDKELRQIYMKKLSTVRFPEKMIVRDDELQQVPPRLRAVYSMWFEGYNIQELYPRATAYRYRKQFIEEYGVDIFMQSPKEFRKTAQVLPMLRPLVAEPCEVPFEAHELGLLAA
jgi:hypothetical protein